MLRHTFAGSSLRSAVGLDSDNQVFSRYRSHRRLEREACTAIDIPAPRSARAVA
jgi:hypothetical protein